MKNIILFILGIFVSTSIIAETVEEQRKTRGFGATYQEALSSALLEAVRQIRGLEVGTEKVLRTNILQSIGPSGHAITTGKESISADIYTKSKGWIQTYEVLEVIKPKQSADQWEIVTLVTVPVYKSTQPKGDTRKTIAVLPFEIVPERVSAHNLKISLKNIASRISDGVLGQLTQSRKFAVVNRSFEAQLATERKLLASDKVSPVEASRLGQKLGADFIMLGKIHELNFKKSDKKLYGLSSTTIHADIDLYYVIIEAATEKIMWADTINYGYSSNNQKHATSEFVSSLSASIVTNVLDVIYPIKILELTGESRILLNQGGKRLTKGQIMEVFTTGETIADPDTGMPIKIDGDKVAELEITAVKPKYSVSKLVKDSGNFNHLTVNAITRRSEKTKDRNKNFEQELTPGSSSKPIKW